MGNCGKLVQNRQKSGRIRPDFEQCNEMISRHLEVFVGESGKLVDKSISGIITGKMVPLLQLGEERNL